jgi:hypothetical protein
MLSGFEDLCVHGESTYSTYTIFHSLAEVLGVEIFKYEDGHLHRKTD